MARCWDDGVIEQLATRHAGAVARLLRWKGSHNGQELFQEQLPWSPTATI
jgi:hypothetical protein